MVLKKEIISCIYTWAPAHLHLVLGAPVGLGSRVVSRHAVHLVTGGLDGVIVVSETTRLLGAAAGVGLRVDEYDDALLLHQLLRAHPLLVNFDVFSG